jgi:regulator of sigma E protease
VLTLVSFVLALAILIAAHEYGHYRVAVACGVKVLRFSIGFGRPLWRWQKSPNGTEFVVSMLPLGGYVKMLDEREAPVDPAERHLAFNTQPLRSRVAIVAAGPAANLLLAVALYALVSWSGFDQPQPVLSSPVPASLAERAGLRGAEWVQATREEGDAAMLPLRSFDDLRWRLTQSALAGQDLVLAVAADAQAPTREVLLPLSSLQVRDVDPTLFQRIGIVAPWSAPLVGELLPGGAAEQAGLLEGDMVRRVDGRPIEDGQQLRNAIRAGVDDQGRGVGQRWSVERDGRLIELAVTPAAEQVDSVWVGRVGAYIGALPEMTLVRYGPLEGLMLGVERTWEVSALTLQMFYRMLVGEASLKNLSGPLTIADYAGKSAGLGWTSYVLFLALVSVSLGVLNLLPVPMLDGGHLMYYLWEAVTGRAVSDAWIDRLQRGGMAVLLALMSLAVFNDIARLLE